MSKLLQVSHGQRDVLDVSHQFANAGILRPNLLLTAAGRSTAPIPPPAPCPASIDVAFFSKKGVPGAFASNLIARRKTGRLPAGDL